MYGGGLFLDFLGARVCARVYHVRIDKNHGRKEVLSLNRGDKYPPGLPLAMSVCPPLQLKLCSSFNGSALIALMVIVFII